MSPPQGTQILQKRYRDQFCRRKKSLLKKAHDFHMDFTSAEVYMCVHHNNRFYVYTSTTNPHWPPPLADIRDMYPLPVIQTPEDLGPLPDSRQAILDRSVYHQGGPRPVADTGAVSNNMDSQNSQGGGSTADFTSPGLQSPIRLDGVDRDSLVALASARPPVSAGTSTPLAAANTATNALLAGLYTPSTSPQSGSHDERRFRHRAAAQGNRVQKPGVPGRNRNNPRQL